MKTGVRLLHNSLSVLPKRNTLDSRVKDCDVSAGSGAQTLVWIAYAVPSNLTCTWKAPVLRGRSDLD